MIVQTKWQPQNPPKRALFWLVLALLLNGFLYLDCIEKAYLSSWETPERAELSLVCDSSQELLPQEGSSPWMLAHISLATGLSQTQPLSSLSTWQELSFALTPYVFSKPKNSFLSTAQIWQSPPGRAPPLA